MKRKKKQLWNDEDGGSVGYRKNVGKAMAKGLEEVTGIDGLALGIELIITEALAKVKEWNPSEDELKFWRELPAQTDDDI